MTVHRALLRANATGVAAGHRSAGEAGRIVWSLDDRAAAYRAAATALRTPRARTETP